MERRKVKILYSFTSIFPSNKFGRARLRQIGGCRLQSTKNCKTHNYRLLTKND